jgi:hypothetical protein
MHSLQPLARALATSCPVAVDLEWIETLDGSRAVAALRRARAGPRRPGPELVPRRSDLEVELDGFHLLEPSGRLHPVWGAKAVTMALPQPLEVPVGCFFQVNRHLVPWLFERAAELAGPPVPTWDLHAGVGFLTAAVRWADRDQGERELVAVESFRPSAKAAAANLPAARVVIGRRSETYLARADRLPTEAMALCDPPRAGLSPDLRRQLAGWHPQRILMLACDPATWARDTSFLLERGYRLGHLELVDLFPSTHHVEIISMLEVA